MTPAHVARFEERILSPLSNALFTIIFLLCKNANIYINNLLQLLIGERAVFLYSWSSVLVAPSAPAAPRLAHS